VKAIKVWYEGFWDAPHGVFCPEFSYIHNVLKKVADIEISKSNPDLIVYGGFTPLSRKYHTTPTLFFSQELIGTYSISNVLKNNPTINITISPYEDSYVFGIKNIYLPSFLSSLDHTPKVKQRPVYCSPCYSPSLRSVVEQKFSSKPKKPKIFAAYGNPVSGRGECINWLNKMNAIDSFGSLENNTNGLLSGDEFDLLTTMGSYMYALVYENTNLDRAMTEKCLFASSTNVIPIYSCHNVAHDFFDFGDGFNINEKEDVKKLVDVISCPKRMTDYYMSSSKMSIRLEKINRYSPLKMANRIMERLW
jgi:hypothetical protein